MAVSDYKTDPNENTTISGINIAEGCPPSGVNNALRQMMADVKAMYDAVNEGLSSIRTTLIDKTYPVGAVYMSASSTSPATLFGGTWEQIQGRFLLAADSAYGAGTTGGEAAHTLTAGEMPAHNHSAWTDTQGNHNHDKGSMRITGSCYANSEWFQGGGNGALRSVNWGGTRNRGSDGDNRVTAISLDTYYDGGCWTGVTGTSGAHGHNVGIGNAGGGAAHNNMPPYLAVYCWKRTK